MTQLLDDACNNACTNGTSTFTDSETESLFDSDGGDQLDFHVDVIAGHNHLNAFRQCDDAGNVCCSEVELGTIAGEERSMTAAFFLLQYVNLALEVCMRMNRAGLCENLAALDLVTLYAAEEQTYVIACDRLLEQLTEHLNAGNYDCTCLVGQTNDFY